MAQKKVTPKEAVRKAAKKNSPVRKTSVKKVAARNTMAKKVAAKKVRPKKPTKKAAPKKVGQRQAAAKAAGPILASLDGATAQVVLGEEAAEDIVTSLAGSNNLGLAVAQVVASVTVFRSQVLAEVESKGFVPPPLDIASATKLSDVVEAIESAPTKALTGAAGTKG